MSYSRSEILQGTLGLMLLKTLDAMGPMQRYGIALPIEQVARDALKVSQGTLYICLVRLLQRKWLSATCGSEKTNGADPRTACGGSGVVMVPGSCRERARRSLSPEVAGSESYAVRARRALSGDTQCSSESSPSILISSGRTQTNLPPAHVAIGLPMALWNRRASRAASRSASSIAPAAESCLMNNVFDPNS